MLFDHVTIRGSAFAASERFYDTVLAAIEMDKAYFGELGAEWGDFSLAPADDDNPVTRGLHVAFAAQSRARVDQFWRTGTEAGYRSDGEPAPRPQYRDDYYGAFLLDPDGNSVEAVHHGAMTPPGDIDHLWIRVADVAASRRFYELVAAHASFRLGATSSDPERARFSGDPGSFSVVAGKPTQHVHFAVPAETNAAVDEFHAALVAAGYRDNGAPGERPIYHEGYYGAFVLDPDGNNVELVNHNR